MCIRDSVCTMHMHDAPWSLCICAWCINVWCIHPWSLILDYAACVCEAYIRISMMRQILSRKDGRTDEQGDSRSRIRSLTLMYVWCIYSWSWYTWPWCTYIWRIYTWSWYMHVSLAFDPWPWYIYVWCIHLLSVILTHVCMMHVTNCELVWWKQSQSWTKVKVVKWC